MADSKHTPPKRSSADHLFRDYVTSTAFALTLTRRQAQLLLVLQRQDWKAFYAYNLASSGSGQLIRRGLLIHDYVPPGKAKPDHAYFKLTKAGELVCELLRVAGFDEATNPMPIRVSRAA